MSEQAGPGWPAGTRLLRVADVIVDLECRELERDAGTVELQQRVFDLLLVLLREPCVLHTRAELFERVWPGVVVEDASLSQAVWLLRRALGEERRHWIRTVPKRGYLFEPPSPPRPVDTSRPAPARRAGGRRHRRALGLAVAGAAAALLMAVATLAVKPGPGRLEEGTVAVAMLQVEGKAAGSRWPALLLQAWLEWKMSTLPEVELVDAAWLAADAAVAEPHVVLLSSGTSASGTHYVRARLDTRDGPRQLELRGEEAAVPRMVDALSRQITGLLLPERATEPWPGLQVDAGIAREYVDAWEAYAHDDMASAAQSLEAVLRKAPGFGLAELQLAQVRATQGQTRLAGHHIARARRLLRPVGRDSERVMAVGEMSLDPARATQAAAAMEELAREYPGRLSRAGDAALLARGVRSGAAAPRLWRSCPGTPGAGTD